MAQPPDKVHLRVGKSGVTEGHIEEARDQLTRTDPLVVRFLQNFTEQHDRKQAAEDFAARAGARVASFRGGTLVLTRRRNP